jgi:hypothetical protein
MANIAQFAANGNPTNASIEVAKRHRHLAQQMKDAGKGPMVN